jgi:hypothetical protein
MRLQSIERDVLLDLAGKKASEIPGDDNLMFNFPETLSLHWTTYFCSINNLWNINQNCSDADSSAWQILE